MSTFLAVEEQLVLPVGQGLLELLDERRLLLVRSRHHHLEVQAPDAESDCLLLASTLLLVVDVVFDVVKFRLVHLLFPLGGSLRRIAALFVLVHLVARRRQAAAWLGFEMVDLHIILQPLVECHGCN